MWDLITFAQFQGSAMSAGQGYSKTLWICIYKGIKELSSVIFLVYKSSRLSRLVVEHSVVIMSVRLNPMGSQFSIPVL